MQNNSVTAAKCKMCSSSLTTLEEWAVTQHYQTKTHRGKAVESSQTGAIAKHVEQASHSHTAAVLAAFQHVYFIAKQELPNSLYTELRSSVSRKATLRSNRWTTAAHPTRPTSSWSRQ